MFEIVSLTSIGLGLFLLGMKIFTEGLNYFAYSRFRYLLANMKVHPILGILIGFIVTGILQSSSATTVILVGLVETNLLTLYQATPIIIGANIGTTITSQIIAFNVGKYGFIPFIISILISLISKNKKVSFVGEILIGFSLIFIGIDLLTKGLSPLKNIIAFQEVLKEFGRVPLLGILLGFLTISILQSSSTGIAILQTLAKGKTISLYSAVSIMLGMNLGTCMTTIISSLPHSKFAKQTAFMHLFFNLIGVILIFPFINLLCKLSIFLSPDNISRQVANAHLIFNIFSMLAFLPFIERSVHTVQLIIRN